MSPAPRSVISQLVRDAEQDPGLPREGPTEAFWQLPPSQISEIRSAELPATTTYAIIGSGITGCSVAKNLLDNLPSDSQATVTLLEARTLCSGATGRNGGHLLSPMPDEFSLVEKYLGKEETIKIARFANRTLDSMHQLAQSNEELSRAAEARKVTSICAYHDQKVFDEAVKSNRRYEEWLPEQKGHHQVFSPEEGLQKYNMKGAAGVITNSAGAFWPYRLVTGVLAQLLKTYECRFSIETSTSVTAVEYEPSTNAAHPYHVKTSRGSIRAAKVVYCSNGWTGHLLPKLRGKLFPMRGTMSVQAAGPDFINEGAEKSWSTVGKPSYDSADGTFSYGLYYITQNEHTGDIFIGGEKQRASEFLSADDTQISAVSQHELVNMLPKIFEKGWPAGQSPSVRKVWSGIMGFTPDHLPYVGQIPKLISGRAGDGEYIAAGFNGYGMPLCWGCGEAVAKMLLGKHEEVETWLPHTFLMSAGRLNSPFMETESGIWGLLMQEPGVLTTAKIVARNALTRVYRSIFG